MWCGWWCIVGCGPGSAILDGDEPPAIPGDADTDADTDSDTEPPPSAPGALPLCINEIMPDNQASLEDASGAFPDWIELHNSSLADLSLLGWTITDDQGDTTRHVLGELSVPAGGYLVLYADGLPALGPDHLSFQLAADGEEVGVYAPDGRGSVVVFGAVAGDLSAARVPDCCTGEGCWQYPFGGTPGASNVPVGATTPLVAAGATWRFWDRGFIPSLSWYTAAYDDGSWATGTAPFGYGDLPATEVAWGIDPLQRFETTWFRASFAVASPAALQTLRLRVLRDDGVAVYVNGIAVYRNNLPAESGEDVLAVNPIDGADEGVWLEATVPLDVLIAGSNSIAVEVHQVAVDSDDMTFDLELLTSP